MNSIRMLRVRGGNCSSKVVAVTVAVRIRQGRGIITIYETANGWDVDTKQAGRLAGLCLLMLLGGSLSGCGKKGPLYLPPGMKPATVPAPETIMEPVIKPETENTDKPRPAATPADKSQP